MVYPPKSVRKGCVGCLVVVDREVDVGDEGT